MNSIRTRLLIVFSVVILAMSIPIAYIFFAQQYMIDQYNRSLDTLLAIQQTMILSEKTTFSYLSFSKDPSNAKLEAEYQQNKTATVANLDLVENQLFSAGSFPYFHGLNNSVESSISVMEQGIVAAKENDLETALTAYDEAYDHQLFIKDAATALLLEELNATQAFRQQIEKIRTNISLLSTGSVVIGILVSIGISITQSEKILRPISQLVKTTQSFSEDNLTPEIDNSLKQRKDEIGKLANSFDEMLDQIKKHIKKLDQSLKELETAQGELNRNNEQLKKLNQHMVGREVKMAEMKKQLKKLEVSP